MSNSFSPRLSRLLNRYYEDLRNQAELRAKQYRTDILKAHPELSSLEQKLKKLYVADILSIASGQEQDNKQVSTRGRLEIAELKEQIKQYKHKNKITSLYDTPAYQCARCSDKGFLTDGQECVCKRRAIRNVLLKHSRFLPPKAFTFTNFDSSIFAQELTNEFYNGELSVAQVMTKLAERLQKMAQSEELTPYLLYGYTGVGKTYLLAALTNQLLDQGVVALFVTANQLTVLLAQKLKLEASFNPDMQELDQCINDYADIVKAKFLVIDDLSATSMSDDERSLLQELLDLRQAEGGITSATSNSDLAQLTAVFGERIISRLAGQSTAIEIQGVDQRQRK